MTHLGVSCWMTEGGAAEIKHAAQLGLNGMFFTTA
jgi:hypothetical protein